MRAAHVIAAIGNNAGRPGFQLLPSRRQRLELPDYAFRRRIAVRASFPAQDNVRPAMRDFVTWHSISDLDRKSVVQGKRVSVRVDLGGRRILKKKKER